jgi:hypothetical protein
MPKEKKYRIEVFGKYVKNKASNNANKIDTHLTIHTGAAETFDTSKEARIKAEEVAERYGTPLILFQIVEFFRRKYKNRKA